MPTSKLGAAHAGPPAAPAAPGAAAPPPPGPARPAGAAEEEPPPRPSAPGSGEPLVRGLEPPSSGLLACQALLRFEHLLERCRVRASYVALRYGLLPSRCAAEADSPFVLLSHLTKGPVPRGALASEAARRGCDLSLCAVELAVGGRRHLRTELRRLAGMGVGGGRRAWAEGVSLHVGGAGLGLGGSAA